MKKERGGEMHIIMKVPSGSSHVEWIQLLFKFMHVFQPMRNTCTQRDHCTNILTNTSTSRSFKRLYYCIHSALSFIIIFFFIY